MARCPALFIGASASHQGKTTVTAALARHHARQGRRVRVFKTGPDFLDPMILERACGSPVYSLHLSMVGLDACRAMLAQAAREADLILIEGVMGLFDGTPSSADLAAAFNVPVLAVIGAHGMAQTFGAVALGLARYRTDVPFHGVLANRVASARHAQMLSEAIPEGLHYCGHLSNAEDIGLPERHLGLTQAQEIANLDARLDRAADAIASTALRDLPPHVAFEDATLAAPPRLLEGIRIAIARDTAFSFVYPANIDLLIAMGATVVTFSPLADEPLPADTDALYLPGGYPELHAAALASNARTQASIREHVARERPVLAECGGMLYLLDTLTDIDGKQHAMLGLLPGDASMQRRLSRLAMQRLDTAHGALTGHTFHYSTLDTAMQPQLIAAHATTGATGEAVYRHGRITATYMHAYWPSNPAATAAIFRGETL
ncbi:MULTISPECIES: cobyrinate a,c-diamide synthase [unclassified Caballeronia]|uniref:cobyrinate a,c-diamide synthase n=1 Tax=unclassified Caballeronia TaxID=2646786 RepID=UPI00286543C4|nr:MULTISPECIES: cobyrinate a,c-diamide synthase [unclassified Caballeronia]MDR5739364.1 cobyrinate a,c-diamide synthase [Caballeronia sp. LZ016]MDR5807853.1 cobyrinate a,c-diamide synthase [Caballeronia sp. LZ019]